MSKTVIYQIVFYNYWHSGSGLAGSTYADSIVNKTERNLPFIPGKTLKGLIRDAATAINKFNAELISKEFIDEVFGGGEGKDEGSAFFSNALLSENLSSRIVNHKKSPAGADNTNSTDKATIDLSDNLYTVFSSTQINENGQAKDGSLRQLEVTIPLTLYGAIEHFPEKYEKELSYCMQWIKELGLNRTRGLGKCDFSII